MATISLKKKSGPSARRDPDRKPVRSGGAHRPTLAKAHEDRARREEQFGPSGGRDGGAPGGFRPGGEHRPDRARPPYGDARVERSGGFQGGGGGDRGGQRPGGGFGGGGSGNFGGGGRPDSRGGFRPDNRFGPGPGDRGPRPGGFGDRPRGDRQDGDRPGGDLPGGERPFGHRPFEQRGPGRDDDRRPMNRGPNDRAPAWGDRPGGDRGRDDRPRGDGDQQRAPYRAEQGEGRGNFGRPSFNPREERPQQRGYGGDRPSGDRPFGDRPGGDRPFGDRPPGDRPFGNRGGHDRSFGDRPRPYGPDRGEQRRPDDRFGQSGDDRRPGPPRDFTPRFDPRDGAPGARDGNRPPFRNESRNDPRGGPRPDNRFDAGRGPDPRAGGGRDFPRHDQRGPRGPSSDFDGGPRPRDDRGFGDRGYGNNDQRGGGNWGRPDDRGPGQFQGGQQHGGGGHFQGGPRRDAPYEGGEPRHGDDRRDMRQAPPRGDWNGPRPDHQGSGDQDGGGDGGQRGRQGQAGQDYPDHERADDYQSRVHQAHDPDPVARPAPRVVPARQAPEGSGERLSKRLGQLGMASRREADDWIDAGWVRVDGKVAHLGQRVGPDAKIEVDPVAKKQQAQRVTILVHKPVGYVSGQAEDGYEPAVVLVTPENRFAVDPCATKFHAGQLRGLAPAGRLDIDSTGLLVLTQDGRVARSLIGAELPDSPGLKAIEKEYLVRVAFDGDDRDPKSRFPAESLALLEHGLTLDEVELQPAKVSWQNEDQLRFVLREGRKRQIRRMCEAVGLVVLGLKRVRIGRITLGALPVGQWRYLAPWEHFE